MGKKKGRWMHISTLGDVVELVNNNTDALDRSIYKLIKKNRTTRIIAVLAIVYSVYAAVNLQKQDEELYKLSIRVNKLESKEGE